MKRNAYQYTHAYRAEWVSTCVYVSTGGQKELSSDEEDWILRENETEQIKSVFQISSVFPSTSPSKLKKKKFLWEFHLNLISKWASKQSYMAEMQGVTSGKSHCGMRMIVS